MVNIFWTKHDIDNRQKVGNYRASYIVFYKLLSTNGLLWGRNFYLLSVFCSVSSPPHTLKSAITWRPTANLNKMTLGLSTAQVRSPQNFNISMAWRLAAVSGNASLIATFSSLIVCCCIEQQPAWLLFSSECFCMSLLMCWPRLHRVSKNCAKLFLPKLRQIFTNFDNFWQKDGREAKIMRGVLIFHLT